MAKKKEPRLIVRIRYDKNWNDKGEHFVFENRTPDEDEWGLDSAFPLCDVEDGEIVRGKGDLIHYTALTKIRELMKWGTDIHLFFSRH